MPQPGFLIIGARKAGTTLLYELLRTHPFVWLPEQKEPDYFIPPNWRRPECLERYLALFDAAPPEARCIGEASTGYATWPENGDAAARIRELLGRPKLLYMLRDPVERALSNFEHSHRRGYYAPGTSVARAIEVDSILVNTSRYAAQLDRYDEAFGADAVHVILMEELVQSPRSVLAGVAKYLELPDQHPDHDWPRTVSRVNSGRQNAASIRADRLLGDGPLRKLARRLPASLKTLLRRRLPLPVGRVPEATAEDVARLTRSLAEDVRRLRRRLGPRIDIWPTTQRLLS